MKDNKNTCFVLLISVYSDLANRDSLLFFLYNLFGNALCVLLQLVFWWLSVIQSFKRLSENLLQDGFGEIVVNRT